VVFLTGVSLLVVSAWTWRRCVLHGALMQVCFGLPYSLWFPLTAKLQWGVAAVVALPARLGLADYTVDGAVVQFPGYTLAITADCSGLGQVLTFVGIAALGVASSAANRRRTLALFAVAIVLAWLSNLARVGMFVLLVAYGAHWSIDSPFWHSTLGFLAFLPFVCVLVWIVLRTHTPLSRGFDAGLRPGRLPIVWIVAPMLAAKLLVGGAGAGEAAAPAWFAHIEQPPGHRLDVRAVSEDADKAAYDTPWLVNARFQDAAGDWFDLFHYTTHSRSHLCVHTVAACLHAPDQRARYEPPVDVGGRAWWRVALDRDDDGTSSHVYFAFEVGGVRLDDSARTQWRVFRERLFGGSWEVRFTRVVLPGPLPAEPTPRERAILGWLGELTASAR
jgi:exosortase/archaeosortase family protein